MSPGDIFCACIELNSEWGVDVYKAYLHFLTRDHKERGLPLAAYERISGTQVQGAKFRTRNGAEQYLKRLVESDLPAGTHDADWNGRDERGEAVAPGVYFYRLVTARESRARKLVLRKEGASDEDETVELGFVGEIESINPAVVDTLDEGDFIPVIAPIGTGEDGKTYNINADTVAGKLAVTLGAEKLILLTNTPGVLDQQGELLTGLSESRVQELIQEGVITGGMLPKVRCALDAVSGGVRTATISDGRVPHATLLETLTDQGVGTQIGRTREVIRPS